jgi:hypothetical protein
MVPVIYLLYSLAIIVFVINNSYSSILQWYGANWSGAFDAETIARNCFTVDWDNWLRGHSVILVILITGILILYFVYSRAIWHFLEDLLEEIGNIIRFMRGIFAGLSKKERVMLMLLFGGILAYRVYFYLAFPLHSDELCSYLFFARQGFFLSATSYPLPNNHVLYNIVCSFLSSISFLSPKAVMRLPSMAGDFILLYSIFCLFKHWGGFYRAMVVVAGIAFCYYPSYYAVQGRGYQLQELCVVLSGMACWSCFFSRNRYKHRGYSLFVVSSVAGLYINPLFIYHFLALVLLLFYLLLRRKEYKSLFFFIRCLFVIMGLVMIFYLPLILGSSWKALVANPAVVGENSWKELFAHFSEFIFIPKYLSYYGTAGMYLILGAIVLSFFLYCGGYIKGRFYYFTSGYFLAILLSLTILILYTKAYPLERSLCFLMLVLDIIFLNVCYDMIKARSTKYAFPLLIIFTAVKITGSVRGLYWDRFSVRRQEPVRTYYGLQNDFKALGALHPTDWQITDSDDFYSMYLRLYLIGEQAPERVFLNSKTAKGDVLFLPDCYVPLDQLQGYTLWADDKITARCETRSRKGALKIYVSTKLLTHPTPNLTHPHP